MDSRVKHHIGCPCQSKDSPILPNVSLFPPALCVRLYVPFAVFLLHYLFTPSLFCLSSAHFLSFSQSFTSLETKTLPSWSLCLSFPWFVSVELISSVSGSVCAFVNSPFSLSLWLTDCRVSCLSRRLLSRSLSPAAVLVWLTSLSWFCLTLQSCE